MNFVAINKIEKLVELQQQQHRKERRREAEEKRGRGEEKQRREHLAANACGRREVKRF